MFADISIRVTPRSSQQRIGVENGKVRAWVMASPTDGQANDAVRRLVAGALGIAPTKVQIIRGDASREKLIRVDGMSLTEVLEVLS